MAPGHRHGDQTSDEGWNSQHRSSLDYRACSAQLGQCAHEEQEAYKRRVNAARNVTLEVFRDKQPDFTFIKGSRNTHFMQIGHILDPVKVNINHRPLDGNDSTLLHPD